MTIKINNQAVEQFIHQQTMQNNISSDDYLTKLILSEIESLENKKDVNILSHEIDGINSGAIKLKSANLLLDENKL